MNPARIINAIKERRAVLFLGQQYLTHDDGANDFYSQIRSKYNLDYKSDCYDIIFEISKTEKDLSQIASWLGKMTGHIAEPAWLRSITHLPWIHIYTSAIDRSMGALFENDGQREIEKIYSKASLLRNKRSPKSLHLTYLFGSTDHVDSSDRPPMNKFVLNTRLIQEVEPLYRRIPEIATPLGLLLMEGYDASDWFKTERLHGLASLLGSEQIVIFNPGPDLQNDDFIQDLIAHDKVILMPGHLADILTPELAEAVSDPLEPEDETEANGVVIRVGERKMRIRQEMTRLISRFGTVLDERLTYPPTHQDASQRYDSFRAFLASTHTYPKWEYFQRGLPFRRDFEYTLKKRVNELLDLNNNASESPLILHGHPSTGKSIGLYSLALDLVKEHSCAVVLIPKNFTELRDNEITDLDEFCQLLEQLWLDEPLQGKSVIIWDGMQSEQNYNKVLNKLRGRGRKVILLGSCYWVNAEAQKNKKNYIEAPDKLSTKASDNDPRPENVRFQEYLKQSFLNEQYYHLAQNTLAKVEDTRNYLSLLYHFLPDARPNIQVAVQGQVSRFSRFIITQYFHASGIRNDDDAQPTIRAVLEELNLFPTEVATPKIRIANDEISYPEFFIFLIAVSDQFGIKVPFEIIYRCFDNKQFCVEIYKQLTANGIIHEFVDLNNNISLGAKSRLEAKILIQSVGGQSKQMVYLSRLLRNISTSDVTVSSTSNQPTADRSEQAYSEIQFAVDLLIRVKDRSHPGNFLNYLYDIANELRFIREQMEVLNPRLMLQEASMLREWVYQHHQQLWKTEETPVEVLRRAEAILIDAREVLDNVRSPLHHFIQVELAATQCFLSIQMSKDGASQGEKAFFQFQQANDLVRAINSLNPDSYEALDVMFWAIRDLVRFSDLTEAQKAYLYAEAKDFLQLAEEEGANNFNKEKLHRRELEIGETFKDYKLSDEAFEKLRETGSKKGYFIRASERLGDTRFTSSMSEQDMDRVRKAYNYLQGARHEINSDFQCMYLLLRLQFIIYNGKPPFAGTHQSLRLTAQQWDNIAVMTNHLLTFDEKNIRPKLLYLKALAEFHQDRISNAIDTFRQLSEETDEMGFGRRRISYHHVVSNPDGSVRTYEGIVNLAATRNKQRGEIYIPELNVRLRYSWHDFKYDLPVQSNVRDFCIAFNFIGPVAIARRVRDNLVGTEADNR